MDFTDVLTRTRLLLQDVNAVIWTDEQLQKMVNDGQVEYARLTGCLRDTFEVLTVDGLGSYPDNFIDFVFGVNSEDSRIYPASWQRIFEEYGDTFLTDDGEPEYIFDNYDSDGEYRVYPVPDQSVTAGEFDSGWGVVETISEDYELDSAWGTITGTAVECLDIWGIPDEFTEFDEAGEIVYSRKPTEDVIEIPDPLSLVYYAAGEALAMETEHKNLNKSKYFMGQFRHRTNKFTRASASGVLPRKSTGSFF